MTATVRYLQGLAVAIVSFVGTIIICVLPHWRVTTASDIQVYEGLWKVCVSSSVYSISCHPYDGAQVLAPELAGARALIVIAIIVGVIGILLGAAGNSFINFVSDQRKKRKMGLASGVVFLIAGIFVVISVCRIPTTPISKLGASVYFGWITTVLFFLGGGLLCSSLIWRNGTGFPLGTSV